MTTTDDLRVVYDRGSDVLYVSLRQQAAHRAEEDDLGIVWRYDQGGHLIGMTIIDFKELWEGHRRVLAARLARGFSVSAPAAEGVLSAIT